MVKFQSTENKKKIIKMAETQMKGLSFSLTFNELGCFVFYSKSGIQ